MGDRTAFFYGTLMAPPVLHRVIYGSTKPEPWQAALLNIQPAILHDFSRHRVRSFDYPALVRQTGSTVRGTFVTGLTTGDMWRLDKFEGDEYARKMVKVRLLEEVGDESGVGNVEGVEVQAQTYIWIAPEALLEKEEWDFGVFQREKIGRWIGSNDEYEGDYEAAQDMTGDPTGGRGPNGKIMQELLSYGYKAGFEHTLLSERNDSIA